METESGQDDVDSPIVGRRLEVLPRPAIVNAVDGLVALQQQGVLDLKIRSGEHIAATVVSSSLGHLPIGGDTQGGADLIYAYPAPIAVEVKSLPDDWRRWEAESAIGRTFQSAFQSLTDHFPEIERAAEAAAMQALTQ